LLSAALSIFTEGYRPLKGLIGKTGFHIFTGYHSIQLECVRGKNAKNKPH